MYLRTNTLLALVYGVIADVFNLNAAVVVMGLATMLILPVSLALRGHLSLAARGA